MLDWFRGRGNAETGPRDGEAPILERLALSEPDGGASPPSSGEPALGPHEQQREILLRNLCGKVLNVHLSNRFQTSYPLVLNFQSLEPGAAALLVEAAAATLLCDPRTAAQPEAVRSRLVEAKASDELMAAFEMALARPRALNIILQEVEAAGLSSHAYAVSLIALGRPNATARHYLAYLAGRLGLGEEIVGSLRRRYQR